MALMAAAYFLVVLGLMAIWAFLPFTFPSRARAGTAIAVCHLCASAAVLIPKPATWLSESGLPLWMVAPGMVTAVLRIAVEIAASRQQSPHG